MRRELIIDDSLGCIRAAVLEDGMLSEIHIEKSCNEDQTECLFLGKVQAVKPSIRAAFVDIGTEQHAFLPLGERVSVRSGEMLIVQGQAKQATDSKGLRITEKINLSGKWLVLLPNSTGVHVSKKVKDPELRMSLEQFGEEICPPECGLIIRTASEEVTEYLLREEAQSLYELWLDIEQKSKGMSKPGLLHARLGLHLRLARDLRDLTKIVINTEAGLGLLKTAQLNHSIPHQTLIEHYNEASQLIFDAYNIETQIDKALKKRVWLPCGGYLIIDHCEAMTVIDVNSGKMVLGRNLEDTAVRVNLEAACEIARQIRLRDIGGIIVVDFIDMHSEENRQKLLLRMREAVSSDRSQVNIEGITRLGLMEMTRRRKYAQLHKALRCNCSYCSGMGEVLSGEEVAHRALRQVRRMVLAGQRGPFIIRCGASVAQALTSMSALEGAQVYVSVSHGRHAEKFDIDQIGAGMPLPGDAKALK